MTYLVYNKNINKQLKQVHKIKSDKNYFHFISF